ncbi:trigger factor-like [Octopus bimaculoides]|uniref:trigger factor-like n=1 Tax=Octopus bimaculoides TaxID=37653 RepID=UPI0022E2D9B6|nr:trigger factor-like [Octopus bimaculoides]
MNDGNDEDNNHHDNDDDDDDDNDDDEISDNGDNGDDYDNGDEDDVDNDDGNNADDGDIMATLVLLTVWSYVSMKSTKHFLEPNNLIIMLSPSNIVSSDKLKSFGFVLNKSIHQYRKVQLCFVSS